MLVKDFMTSDPIALLETNTMADARKLMSQLNVRHVPVVDDGKKLVGIVSELRVHGHATHRQYKIDPEILADADSEMELNEIMVPDYQAVTPEEDILRAARLMNESKLTCLPVISDQKQLLGIITQYDLTQCLIQLLEHASAQDLLATFQVKAPKK